MDWNATEKYLELEAKAWSLFATSDRGTIVEHAAIEQATGLVRHGEEWKNLMRRIKRRCRKERSIWVYTKTKEGYLLCTDQQAINLALKRSTRLLGKRGREATRNSKCINQENLSYRERMVLQYQLDQVKNATRSMNKCRYASKVVGHPKPIAVS